MFTMPQGVQIKNDWGLKGTGWLAPVPDLRDYTVNHQEVKKIAKKLGLDQTKARKLDSKVDLREFCSAMKDQKELGSCTAHAATGVVEYYAKKAFGNEIDGSRLFVYKTTRNLMGVAGDTGAYLRNTMGALALCGMPPEKYWPYTDNKVSGPAIKNTFDDEPTAFVYSIADNFEALVYFCHDPLEKRKNPDEILKSIKEYLAAGIPAMFGFYGFDSFNYCDVTGGIPYPCPGEPSRWGHAVVAVGYNDDIKIANTLSCVETKGALLIRNSWGTCWGELGYGWLPYQYVLNGLASDFWSLLSMEWVETGKFGY